MEAWNIEKPEVVVEEPIKTTRSKTTKEFDFTSDEIEVLEYLNDKAGKKFTATTRNIGFIRARIKKGYTKEQLIYVVDLKVSQWNGTQQEKYLRPETLFNERKFESYINERTNGTYKPVGTIQRTADAINKAQSFDWGLD